MFQNSRTSTGSPSVTRKISSDGKRTERLQQAGRIFIYLHRKDRDGYTWIVNRIGYI